MVTSLFIIMVTLLLLGSQVAEAASWRIVSSPNTGTSSSLSGVAVISASNIWAVGGYTYNSSTGTTLGTLTELYS